MKSTDMTSSEVRSRDLAPARHPGESFEHYKKRRRVNNIWLKRYKKGKLQHITNRMVFEEDSLGRRIFKGIQRIQGPWRRDGKIKKYYDEDLIRQQLEDLKKKVKQVAKDVKPTLWFRIRMFFKMLRRYVSK